MNALEYYKKNSYVVRKMPTKMIFLMLYCVSSAFLNFVSDGIAVFDPLLTDDLSDNDLYDIVSLSITKVDHNIDIYTKEDKQKWVDLHNIYRKNLTGKLPQGSNLQFMEWNNTLEWAATEYLRYCIFKHGRAEIDSMTGWVTQGQNMYKGDSRLLSRPMYLYYMEYIWYHFNNLTCWKPHPKFQCGHMITLLWAETSHLGSARRSYCFPNDKQVLVGTHYLTVGYVITPGYVVYKFGWPCTRCPDGYFCTDKLCANARQCRDYSLDCTCKRVCQNCGKPDWKNCKCQCKPGWDWEDCSFACTNAADILYGGLICIRSRPERCQLEEIHLTACHKTCKVCPSVVKTPKNADTDEFCCDGKVCQPYYGLNTKTCECELLCPSALCLFPPSTTPPTKYIAMTTLAPNVSKSKYLVVTSEKPKKNRPLQDMAAENSAGLILPFSLWMFHIIWMV